MTTATQTHRMSHAMRAERRAMMADAVRAGESINEVAGRFSVSVETVYKAAAAAGVIRAMTREEKEQRRRDMAAKVNSGRTVPDVAAEFSVSASLVELACRAYGVRPHGRFTAPGESVPEFWKAIDWRLTDRAIAVAQNVTRERVRQVRRALGKPNSPDHKRLHLGLIQFLKDNRDEFESMSADEFKAKHKLAASGHTIWLVAKQLGFSRRPTPTYHANKYYNCESRIRENIRENDNGCWEWQGNRWPAGYGQVCSNCYAHRHVYETLVGPIPKGRMVLHHCDNPPCVNPKHLYIGTAADNASDRVKRNSSRRLSDEDIAAVKRMLDDGKRMEHIAHDINASFTTVARIARRYAVRVCD